MKVFNGDGRYEKGKASPKGLIITLPLAKQKLERREDGESGRYSRTQDR